PLVDAVVRPLLEDLAGPVRSALGGDGAFGAELERQLFLLRPGTEARWFVAQQLLIGAGAALSVLAFCLAIGQLAALGLMLAVLVGVAGFLAPQVRLRARARQRREQILTELPA